jgi:membrane protease YdiL (CAAX protease family)
MRKAILKATLFVGASLGLLVVTGPIVGISAAMTGRSAVPVWVYSSAFSALTLAASALAMRIDGKGLRDLGLVPAPGRVRELGFGFALGVVLFAGLAIVRGATVGATWSFGGSDAALAACGGLGVALVLMLPEELVFRGYAFQQLLPALGARTTIVVSSLLFGLYHVMGSGMWGIGAFFQFAMPALGGLAFGFAAVRTRGLALPIGLHLGGNWVQASVLSFQAQSSVAPTAVWTAHVTDLQQRALFSPDLGPHVPFMVAMLLSLLAVQIVFRKPRLQS